MGLDAASIGPPAIARAVRQRVSALHLQDPSEFWELVRGSSSELQELIEAVVVPETWFFRDREPFAALARIASDEWLPTHPEGALNLLSVPCSSGEEPYSMAMALVDGGFPAHRFRIDAMDISKRALARAERGVYGKNSFRESDQRFRHHHFEAAANGYRVSRAVREQVQFRHGNLIAEDFLPGERYDVIFCRNVLIYFDRATQGRVIRVLNRLLTANGLLFVAPSETGLVLTHDFVPAKVPLAFGFRKGAPKAQEPQPVAMSPVQRGLPRTYATPASELTLTRPPAIAPSSRPSDVRPDAQPLLTAALDDAARLADQGRVIEALACCKRHLREQGPTARAFQLLGLLNEASGKTAEAVGFYRKALYLEPNSGEVLIHLALLLETLGKQADAQVLRSRARRLEQTAS